MTRTDKFFYNATTSLIYQLITLISGVIIPRLMLETYGSEVNGLVSSISQFISYFALVEAGLAAASVFALYKPPLLGDSIQKRWFFDSFLFAHHHTVFGADRRDPADGKAADRTNGAIGICCDDAGG